ncbi:MAG: hypothetical protein Q9157_009179 [Trypethelium eluteriae]
MRGFNIESLIPEDNYTVPPEAEGTETTPTSTRRDAEGEEEGFRMLEKQKTLTVLGRERPEGVAKGEADREAEEEVVGNQTISTGNTTKRHRQTTVEARRSVDTIEEKEEEDEEEGEPQLENSGEPTVMEHAEALADPPPTALKQPNGEHDIPELRIDGAENGDGVDGGEEAKAENESAHGDATVLGSQDGSSAEEHEEESVDGDQKAEASPDQAAEEESDTAKPEETTGEEASE